MHPLDASLELHPAAPPQGAIAAFACHGSERYRNAIGPFGGWIAALLLKAVMSAPSARGAPLALDALFMGSMDDDQALDVRVFQVRQNRSVGFWRSEVWQADRICAQAQVTLSGERQGIVLEDARPPVVPAPETVAVYDNPRTPVPWVDQYIFRPVSGMLFSRAACMDARLWIRDAEPRSLDCLALTAICDTPFPSPWIRLSGQVPVSTVSYSVYYRASAADLRTAGAGYCLLDSRASLARAGYVDQYTSVWSESGQLLAQTQQMLWIANAPVEP
ncbi:MAG: thioesterase family protein [Burkholderiales bacterium]|nr:thioesterase family protein [Burkholderiales bacterium]